MKTIKERWLRKIFYFLFLVLVVVSVFNFLVYYHIREKSCSESPGSLYSAPQWVYRVIRNIILIGDQLYWFGFITLVILVIVGFSQKGFPKIIAGILLIILIAVTLLFFQGANRRCRDCIRVGDLYQVSLFLEKYYKDNGKYPGVAGRNQWDTLQKIFQFNIFNIHDPCYNEGNLKWDYEYWVSPDGQRYVLKANRGRNNLMADGSFWLDHDLDGNILGAYCGENGPQEREYCVSPYFK